jgi:hypothetical protein
MADTAPPVSSKAPPKGPPARRKRGWLLLLLGLFNALWALLVLTAVAAVGAVYFFYDRPVVVPAWVETRIETRLAEEFPQAKVSFGEVRLLMEEGWRPRVRLRDVAVAAPDGRELIRFSEARVRLSMAALRRGRLQSAEVALRGVFATLVREQDGTIALQTGLDTATPEAVRKTTNLGTVVARIDEVLQQPGLAALESAELRGLTLQFIDRRAGRAFTLDGGRLIAQRRDGALVVDADLAVLGDGAGVTTLQASYSSPIGAPEAQFAIRIENALAADIATQSPAFAWLGALRAPLSGSVRAGVRADGTLAPLSAALTIGAGVVQPNAGTRPIPFDAARSYFTYDAAKGLLEFDEVSVTSKWVTARAEGTATLTGLRTGTLEALVGQFRLTQLRANPAGFYPAPIELDRAEIDFRLRTAPFKLDIGRLDLFDQGRIHRAYGALEAEPEGWRLALDARADSITPERIMALWPQAVKTKTRTWLAENLVSADISNADFALRLSPDAAPRSYLAFDYAAASVRFVRTLPPVSKARGHASLDDRRFVVSIDAGEVAAQRGGSVQIDRSAFIIPDTSVKGGAPAVVRLNTRSSVAAALWMLDQPPMGVMQRTGLPVDLAEGQAALSGTLSLPLMKGGSPADVTYDVTGTLSDLSSTRLIAGRTLTAPALALTASNKNVEISGDGTLDGVAFDARWQQPIGAGSDTSTLTGSAQITPQALDAFGVALPPGTLSGTTAADIALTFRRGLPPRMTLRSDLQGAALSIPQLGWRKAATARGALAVDIRLGASPEVTSITLGGGGLAAAGTVTLAQGGGLGVMELETLRVNDWLNVRAALVGKGAGRAPQVVVRGGTLDLRTAEFGGAARRDTGPPAPPMQVRLDRLQITDTIWLEGLAGTFATAGGLDGPFEARVNGGTGISGRVVPQGGRVAVRVTSADAGGVLRSAGVLKQAVGGTLDLSLVPVGSGGAFDGNLTVRGVSIRDAPSMAALVNAISVVGLVNEMNGDGIYFDEVEAAFRLTPGRMTLSSGSAVGASLGLSMDGVFATDTGRIAMQGVITPVYLLNGIGALLTRKGEGLLGLTYRLSGNARAPDVSINPLSVLAPGGLRDIFRGPQTQVPRVEGETAPLRSPSPTAPVERPHEGR